MLLPAATVQRSWTRLAKQVRLAAEIRGDMQLLQLARTEDALSLAGQVLSLKRETNARSMG